MNLLVVVTGGRKEEKGEEEEEEEEEGEEEDGESRTPALKRRKTEKVYLTPSKLNLRQVSLKFLCSALTEVASWFSCGWAWRRGRGGGRGERGGGGGEGD